MQTTEQKSRAREGQTGSRLELLLSRARTGSNSALGRALNTCRPRLMRIARKAVGNNLQPRVGASDVVQDTFVNAAKSFGYFRGHRASEFLAWLRAILFNRLAEVARRAALPAANPADESLGVRAADRLARQADENDRTPESIAVNHEYSALIRAALERIAPRDQQVLRLRFEEQLTFPEIGQRLELSEDAARMLFKRAVKRVKRNLPAGAGV